MDQMPFDPTYQIFLIADTSGTPIVAEAEGGLDCIIGYSTKELAELYIEEAAPQSTIPPDLLPINSPMDLLCLLRSIRDDVPYMTWNNTLTPSVFTLLEIDSLIEFLTE